jgi:AcrR family transcriptional regulator
MENSTTYQNWIDKGYELFTHSGPDGIKVETLARKMHVSKSSFYYHFGDQETFLELLLEEHYHITERFGADAKQCKAFVPDFIDVMLKYQSAILFQRQLRIHRENLDFQLAYQRAADTVNREMLPIWAKHMGIDSDMNFARSLYTVIEDSFYERVREKTFSLEWIYGFLHENESVIQGLVKRSHSHNSAPGIVR